MIPLMNSVINKLFLSVNDNLDDLPDIEPLILDPLEIADKEEEHYLQNDSAAKFQFSHNRITAFANDHPEFNSGGSNVEALSIAPGEGK